MAEYYSYDEILHALDSFMDLSMEDQTICMEAIEEHHGICAEILWLVLTTLTRNCRLAHRQMDNRYTVSLNCFKMQRTLWRIVRLMAQDLPEEESKDLMAFARIDRQLAKLEEQIGQLETQIAAVNS